MRVVGFEEGMSKRGQLHKALWVLVVDKQEQQSNWNNSYDPPDRYWMEKSDRYTGMTQGSNFSSGDDDPWQYTGDIVVSMFASARTGYLNVRRKGAWVKMEEYWPYPPNSEHHERYADGCNGPSSDHDSEGASDEPEEEELDMNSTD